MPHPLPERALRRLVADLAAVHADDLAAILAALDPSERERVEPLLRDYAAYFDSGAALSVAQAGFDATRLSPWLVARIEASGSDFAISPHARGELRDCAARLFPAASVSASTRRSARRGLTARALSVFSRRRRAA